MKCIEQINNLRAAIQSGEHPPGAMVGSEFAFSQQWEMSRNTVRRGIETLIEEGLLERRPGKGLFVRAPHTTFRTVQVIVPDLNWSHVVKISRGTKTAGQSIGVQTQVYDAHGDMAWDLEMIRQLPNGPTDGAVIVSLHHRQFSEVLYELKRANYPFVLVDQRLHDIDVPSVEIDNYAGGYMVGQKLAELGHQRAAFVGPTTLNVVNHRLNGFRDATLDSGIFFDRGLVVDINVEGLTEWLNERLDAVEGVLLKLLASPNRPTVVFDGSGDIVPVIYRAAKKLKLSVPNDISVVSFDDDAKLGAFLDPPVAQLKHPWEEMGRIALEMVMNQIKQAGKGNRETGEPEEGHVVLQPEWIEGQSLTRVRG